MASAMAGEFKKLKSFGTKALCAAWRSPYPGTEERQKLSRRVLESYPDRVPVCSVAEAGGVCADRVSTGDSGEGAGEGANPGDKQEEVRARLKRR